MTEPPTLLIRETDDDRTLIDPIRLRDPDPPFAGSGRASSSTESRSSFDAVGEWMGWQRLRAAMSGRGRRIIEAGLVLALVMGLGSLAYQQWRTAGALREAIVAMRTSARVPLAADPDASGGRTSVTVGLEPRLEVAIRHVDVSGREELELRGANLVGSNDFVGALAHYQTLTKLFPADAAFRDVVTALKAKLRCDGRGDPLSHICL
ncbi:MAG: hypothetical protein JRG67_04970 [Deltaproteobacteria bacterium]|nr:hypothetical protein [Deltaproteobacteria bacterium]MBW1874259.1 hypothetical protein [Deltaproteobacteria bacterium]MBW2210389.1 hypothetical protein [Deltaproteobacteria bacterium]MBW2378502.1 hypothetical protein [Deltaproteobacteria bacterium]MBW2549905.1 hypothetical protein [Deltaproteobacteria bacterium]